MPQCVSLIGNIKHELEGEEIDLPLGRICCYMPFLLTLTISAKALHYVKFSTPL
jgi:hypothetical protein